MCFFQTEKRLPGGYLDTVLKNWCSRLNLLPVMAAASVIKVSVYATLLAVVDATGQELTFAMLTGALSRRAEFKNPKNRRRL